MPNYAPIKCPFDYDHCAPGSASGNATIYYLDAGLDTALDIGLNAALDVALEVRLCDTEETRWTTLLHFP